MKVLDHIQTLEALCKATHKWGMYINLYSSDTVEYSEYYCELFKAAPWLEGKNNQVIADESGFVLFDTEEEMNDTYERTVGDDGPTAKNPYNGRVRVYAITCDPEGQTMNENT